MKIFSASLFSCFLLTYLFRDEIAGCIEKAYEKIAFSEAARMLFFETEKPMKTYAEEVSQSAEIKFYK